MRRTLFVAAVLVFISLLTSTALAYYIPSQDFFDKMSLLLKDTPLKESGPETCKREIEVGKAYVEGDHASFVVRYWRHPLFGCILQGEVVDIFIHLEEWEFLEESASFRVAFWDLRGGYVENWVSIFTMNKEGYFVWNASPQNIRRTDLTPVLDTKIMEDFMRASELAQKTLLKAFDEYDERKNYL